MKTSIANSANFVRSTPNLTITLTAPVVHLENNIFAAVDMAGKWIGILQKGFQKIFSITLCNF